eukprot:NODE_2375_length_617_cov_160.586268_g2018_i0.p3 GENE.NODE_2375_length_617_cov_160.586268_g2018_i0~~NODE_2375_length_617_cov_160.586268_g2018_i0.p3  ORF type:complete len:61 (-),score=13.01 NODE_2375_length_617_cov_160.586268_g2018_i0:435-596(-)
MGADLAAKAVQPLFRLKTELCASSPADLRAAILLTCSGQRHWRSSAAGSSRRI